MTRSLTERLQDRLASERLEIENLTGKELHRLGESLRHASSVEAHSTLTAIEDTHRRIRFEIETIQKFTRWWWVALIVTWMVIGGFYAWHWMRPRSAGIELYQTFEFRDRKYLLLPDGTQATTCRQSETAETFQCVLLPDGR